MRSQLWTPSTTFVTELLIYIEVYYSAVLANESTQFYKFLTYEIVVNLYVKNFQLVGPFKILLNQEVWLFL